MYIIRHSDSEITVICLYGGQFEISIDVNGNPKINLITVFLKDRCSNIGRIKVYGSLWKLKREQNCAALVTIELCRIRDTLRPFLYRFSKIIT